MYGINVGTIAVETGDGYYGYGINVGTIAVETGDGYHGYGINVVDSITSNLYGVCVGGNIIDA